jgi:hypothetical protein
MQFELPGYAVQAGDLLVFKIPGLERDFPEVALEQREYDIDYKTSEMLRHRVVLNIPEGYAVKYAPPDMDLSSKYATYKSSCSIEEDRIVFEDTYRQLTRFVPVSDYEEHRKLLQKIALYSKQQIFFEKTP